jgi:fibro-slime domain-containing protein
MRVFVFAILVLAVCASGANAGLTGYYYNMSSTHPDMESVTSFFVDLGMVENSLTGDMPTLTSHGNDVVEQWDWWDGSSPDVHYVGSRIDSDADLNGAFASSWFPSLVNDGLDGDPHHFAVHWTGSFYVDADQVYNYQMGSDDDAWLFIDGQLMLDLGGVHALTFSNYDVGLTKGTHTIDIFFAERHTVQSGFQLNFFTDLEPEPVPEPTTFLLVGLGLAGGIIRKKFKK